MKRKRHFVLLITEMKRRKKESAERLKVLLVLTLREVNFSRQNEARNLRTPGVSSTTSSWLCKSIGYIFNNEGDQMVKEPGQSRLQLPYSISASLDFVLTRRHTEHRFESCISYIVACVLHSDSFCLRCNSSFSMLIRKCQTMASGQRSSSRSVHVKSHPFLAQTTMES